MRVASLDVTSGGFVRGFSGGHSFAGGAVGGLCDLEGGGEMRRARSSKEGRGEPALYREVPAFRAKLLAVNGWTGF